MLTRILSGVVLLAVFAWLNVGSVDAHARLDRSVPAVGAVLDEPPEQVELFFTQEIQKVSGTYGVNVEREATPVTSGNPVVDDADRTRLTVALEPNLDEGRYVVRWHNVSDADGDPAEGAFSFYVGRQPTPEELAADEELAAIGAEDETPVTEPTPAETPAGPTPTAVIEPVDGDEDDDGGTAGVIAIIVFAVVAALGLLAVGWVILRRS